MHDVAPLHAPEERELLTRADGWEVRVLPERDYRYAYFARNEMLHLQLWHPDACVSMISPSVLTARRWEIYAPKFGKVRLSLRAAIDRVLRERLSVRAPNPTTVAGLEFWFVRVPSGSIFDIEIRAIG